MEDFREGEYFPSRLSRKKRFRDGMFSRARVFEGNDDRVRESVSESKGVREGRCSRARRCLRVRVFQREGARERICARTRLFTRKSSAERVFERDGV